MRLLFGVTRLRQAIGLSLCVKTLPLAPKVIGKKPFSLYFTVAKPDTAWVTDITYIRTWQGWLYSAIVIDLYSRRVVGWPK